MLLSDDQRLLRDGLRTLLGLEAGLRVVVEAENGWQAVTTYAEHRPNAVRKPFAPWPRGRVGRAVYRAQGAGRVQPPAGLPGRRAGRPDGESARFLALIVQGLSNRQIAERLPLTEGTVKNHASNILNKPGVADRTQAAIWAKQCGF